MKKIILSLIFIFIVGGSVYTVNNYNSSALNEENTSNQNSTTTKKDSTNTNITKNNSVTSTPKINSNAFTTKAIDFKLKDLSGKEISLSDLKGKRVFLNFWASWCPPCKAEMPNIEKLYEETKNSDLVIIAVNLGEDKDTVKSFIDKNNYNFTVLLDSNQSVAEKYNISSIPTSFFIDKNGKIVSKKIGAMTLEEMKAYVDLTKK